MAERRVALIIANYEYDDPALKELIAPARDAEQFAAVLEDPAIGNFDVTIVINQPHYKVRQEIERLFADRHRDDLTVLYFSGHGIKDQDGRLYLATIDTDHKRPRASAVDDRFIRDVMLQSRSRSQVLVLDCCYSGAFAQGMVARGGDGVGTLERFQGSGRIVLTASDAMQYAFEGDNVSGDGVSSVFTSTVVEGLKSGAADLDKDGYISIDELYEYLHEQVRQKTPNQTPIKSAIGARGELLIARNPVPVVKRADLPPELIEAIGSPDMLKRAGAVTELSRLLKSKDPGLVLAAYEQLQVLVEDDSRRISALAAEAIANHLEKPAVKESPAPAGSVSVKEPTPVYHAVSPEPFSLSIDPQSVTSQDSVTVAVRVRNESNRDRSYALAGSSDQRLKCRLEPRVLSVAQGETAQAALSLSTTPRTLGGTRRLSYTVEATEQPHGVTNSVQGTFIQPARMPMWLALFISMYLLLFVCGSLAIGIGEL